MENHFQTRVLRPLAITFGVLLLMAGFIGLVASVLLWNTHNGALVIAALGAAGILFVVSLVAGRDRLAPPQRLVAVTAGLLPLLVGGLYAADVIGGIPDEQRNINVQPLIVVPDDAPIIAAENSQEFCLLEEDGSCTPVETWEVGHQGEAQFAFEFVNLEVGVPHNVSVYELVNDGAGDPLLLGELITGEDRRFEIVQPGLDVGDYYFRCDVHPVMDGVLAIVEAAEGDQA